MLKKTFRYILIVCTLILIYGCKQKDQPNETTDVNEVQQDVAEAVETGGSYLQQQKESMMEKVNETYNQLEKDTRQLITDIKDSGNQAWQDMSTQLDEKLNTARQKLTELQEAGKENWQDTKDAFDTAINELQDAYQNVKAEYDKPAEK